MCVDVFFFFFQAEDGIRDLVRSRGLGDVYKRQVDEWVDGDHITLVKNPYYFLAADGYPKFDTLTYLSLIHI